MNARSIAYFSMEVALDPAMPTYAGGLGVLAGDTIRSAADLEVPMVGVSLLHRHGFLKQHIDTSGWQHADPCDWDVAAFVRELPARVSVNIEGRTVHLRAWEYVVKGVGGFSVPVFLLDSDLPENLEWDRALTHVLYGGDAYYRICQEIILGIGGVRLLRALGFNNLQRFHMNEGHAAFLGLELLDESAKAAGRPTFTHADVEAVRRRCVFTTHTPVAAGHDRFSAELVNRVLRRPQLFEQPEIFCCDGLLNMTFLALNLSHYVNGLAKKHAEVSRLMFARYKIDAITNGVHAATWVSAPLARVLDHYIPGWQADNFSLRFAHSIPRHDIRTAHGEAKRQLFDYVQARTGATLDEKVLTLGFARRATAYKRANLIFHDVERLRALGRDMGRIQIIFSGKAHANDPDGKGQIQRILQMRDLLKNELPIVYLTDYDMSVAKLMVAGVDMWLNTPQPPLEASGTSGMKAALNGVPSLSVLDGWWIEGCLEGETGWSIGERHENEDGNGDRSARDAASLYDRLEQSIIPLFYENPDRFTDVMRHAISLNGSFFNTQRMIQQYVLRAYFE
jgi:starch phosphorylase